MNLRSSSNRAFTLIELLVVITIIAVLAGLLLPVTGKVMENARKTSAKSTESQIVNAVNQYFAEYGSYPVPTSASTTSDYTYDDGTTNKKNGTLFNVLRGINDTSDPSTSTLNARRVSYFEMKNVRNVTTPKDGFILTGSPKSGNKKQTLGVGDLVDPWGNLYFVRLDADYSNAVGNPYSVKTDVVGDPTNASNLRTGVIAYSLGLDGTLGTTALPGDDVVSWQ